MRSRHFHASGKLAAWLGVASLMAVLLVPLGSARPSLRAEALRDALHLPCFALVVILLHAALPTRRLAAAVLPAILLAGLSELLQGLGPRTPGWQDFGCNLLGILTGTAILLAKKPRGSSRHPARIAALAAICLGATALAALPWLRIEHALLQQARAFPRLGDFENPWESLVWIPQPGSGGQTTRVASSSARATRGRRSLEVATAGAPWSGVRLLFESPAPWPTGRSLRFDVINPGEPFELGIRADAADGRRFTGQARILPGTNSYRIAPSRLSDGTQSLATSGGLALRTLVFHLGDTTTPRTFHLDHVRLD